MNARFQWWRDCLDLAGESEMLYMAAMKAREQGRPQCEAFADLAALYAWRCRQMRAALLNVEPEERLKCLSPTSPTPTSSESS